MKNKKRYIAVHLLNDYSGSPRVLANCLNVLLDRGDNVELFTSGKSGFLSNIKCVNHSLPYKRCENKYLTLFFYLFSQVHLFLKILIKFSFEKNSTHNHMLVNTLLPFGAALAGKVLGMTVVYYVHETSITPILLKKWLKFVMNKTAAKAIYVSENLKSLEGFENEENIKEEVIYNSLPNNQIHTPIVKNNFQVFMPASLKDYKGIYEFVEISNQMLGTKILFVLALNAEQKAFDEFVKSVKVEPNLTVQRRPTNMSTIYRDSSLVLNLSQPNKWIETFGMTVIEAYSFGIPVIVPPVGGIAEIVTEGVTGFKISVENMSEIKNKILELSSNAVLYNGLVNEVLVRANDFTLNKYKDELFKKL